MQETWVQSLVEDDRTHRGASKPDCRNYGACALGRGSWSPHTRARAQQDKPPQGGSHTQQPDAATTETGELAPTCRN